MDNFFSLQTFFRWPVIATYYISNDLPHDYGEQFQIVNVNLEVFYLNVDIERNHQVNHNPTITIRGKISTHDERLHYWFRCPKEPPIHIHLVLQQICVSLFGTMQCEKKTILNCKHIRIGS